MIKWLLTGLEDACSNEAGVASKVWDYLDLEMESSPRPAAPMWEDAPSPSAAPAAMPVDDDLLWRNCMWGGRCGSHDHGAFSTRCDAVSKAPPRVPGAGESVLKSSAVLRAQPPPSPPPERELADSEKAMVFVSMTDVVCDVRWTACPAPAPPPSITALHVHEDHSYHLTRHSRTLHLDNLGVQTPSDSGTDDDFFEDEIMELPDLDADDVDFFGPESVFKDFAEPVDEELPPIKKSTSDTESGHHMSDSDEEEEIDVVSVLVEKKARTLPTNPSVQDCHQLQQTVADAVGRSGRRLHHRRHHRHHRHRHHHRRRRDNQHSTKVKKYRMSEAADDLSASNKPGPCRGRPKKYRPVELAGDSEGICNNPRPSKLKKLRLMESADDSDEDCNIKLKKHRTKEWKGVDSKGKRSLHNNMERQRRIDLSNQVWSLRQMVPAISDNHRAPRIVVLREAADYCRQLQVQATQLAAYKHELLRHNERLQNMHQLMLKKLQHQAGRRRGKKSSRRSKDSMC